MLRTRIILIVVSAALVILLFMLPKVVVENDSQLAQAPTSDSVANKAEVHAAAPAELVDAISDLRGKYATVPEKEKNAIFADSLAGLYQTAGKFDSAAWFAEEASKFFNTPESWIKAGDHYYQAYTFALDQTRQKQFAAKSRAFYDKVLEKNPKLLDVKTKKAMTYLSEANPMQGIAMLREVLVEDPKNELALFNMGMLSVQSGQYERAVERLEELIAVNPDHTQGHLLLGIALMNTGNKARAREQFEKVKLLDKDPSVQATVDSYLKDLK
jgi:tetratricopeptide (TPR) repeat protein